MKFFIDNNLGHNVAKGMSGFGEPVTHLKDHFEEDVADEVWLKFIGSNGWTLVTRDNRIRYRPGELAALCDYNVGAFFLGGKNKSGWELIQQVVRHWPRMKELAGKTRKPFAFQIPSSGTTIKPLILK